MNISSVNLNLLVAFDALVEERSVTRAARRVGLSQSAMSNALANLRALFGDALFVRARYGIVPTARALALSGPIRQGLRQLDHALSAESGFDPRTSERAFVIGTNDYVEYVLLPPLMKRLSDLAPRVRIELRHWAGHSVPEDLRSGSLDLMIGYYGDVPPMHDHMKLFRETYVCVVRKGHPRVGKKLTLKTYVGLSHVLVSQVQGGAPGEVDVALAKLGHGRHVGLRVSHFLLVPPLIAQTDMVAALSRRIAEPFARLLPLTLLEPPLALPAARIGQVWHERTRDDPALTWLRAQIADLCAAL